MDLLIIKIILVVLIIILFAFYYHVKIIDTFYIKERFITTPTITSATSTNLSYKITRGIATKLGISPRRIQNLTYNGDIDKKILMVSFTILEPNIMEKNMQEQSALDAATIANTLFNVSNFVIQVDGENILLKKINSNVNNLSTNEKENIEKYFNNNALLDIAKYSNQKFKKAPSDDSLTKFYKLDIDENYKIIPTLD